MLRIETQTSNDVATLSCTGRLVYGFEAEMLRTIAHSCAKSDLRIDLSAVTSIDAAGLGLLVELQTWADMNSRTLTLLDLSENVWRMVILTKLCAALEISYSDLIARDPEVDRRHHRQLIA